MDDVSTRRSNRKLFVSTINPLVVVHNFNVFVSECVCACSPSDLNRLPMEKKKKNRFATINDKTTTTTTFGNIKKIK